MLRTRSTTSIGVAAGVGGGLAVAVTLGVAVASDEMGGVAAADYWLAIWWPPLTTWSDGSIGSHPYRSVTDWRPRGRLPLL